MADEIKVEALGLRELIGGIQALEKNLKGRGLNRLATEVGAALLDRTRKRFLAETDPDGVDWIPSTFGERRKEEGKGGGTLFDTGTLFHSIQLSRAVKGTVSIGTDVPYARKHQEGEDGEVQRVFLGFGPRDVAFSNSIIARRLDKIFDEFIQDNK